jgi:hypothetical protein
MFDRRGVKRHSARHRRARDWVWRRRAQRRHAGRSGQFTRDVQAVPVAPGCRGSKGVPARRACRGYPDVPEVPGVRAARACRASAAAPGALAVRDAPAVRAVRGARGVAACRASADVPVAPVALAVPVALAIPVALAARGVRGVRGAPAVPGAPDPSVIRECAGYQASWLVRCVIMRRALERSVVSPPRAAAQGPTKPRPLTCLGLCRAGALPSPRP